MARPSKRSELMREEMRLKIKTSHLLNILQNHVLENAKLSQTQIKASEILLRKCLPDLTATTLDASKGLVEAIKGIQVIFGTGE